MHGAGEQQQRYRYNARSDEQHHHPSTSSHQYQQQGARQMHQMHPIQATLMCTPTTTSAAASTSSSGGSNSSGGSGGHRQQGNILRIGNSIKIGDNILEPAGTLVFSQADGTPWTGQRIVVNGSTHAVVKANLFPIGTTPPVLNMQSNQNWYMNQPSGTVPMSSNAPATTSSATPDSGIQSVPTSPPSPSYAMMNDVDIGDHDDEEDDDGPADFTDMPLLKPVDEDDDCYDVPCTSEGPPPNNSNPAITTIPSSCSTPAPPKESLPTGMNVEEWGSFLIASNMDREEIVRRLMAHDPEMAKAIAMRIRELSAEESKKKKDMEAEVSSTTPTTPRARGTRTRNKCATRSTNSPDVTTSNLPEEPSTSTMGLVKENEDVEKVEGKRRGRKPKKRRGFHKESFEDLESDAKKSKAEQHEDHLPEASCSSRPESVIPPPVDPIQFRLKVREMMERKLEQLTQKMSEDMTELRLSHLTSSKMVNGERGKRRESFLRQLNEQSKKLRKGGMLGRKRLRMFMTESDILEENKDNIKKEVKEESTPPPTKLRGRLPSRRTREPSEIVNPEPVEKKFNGEYFEITKSVPSSDDIIPLWMAPSLTCGCTKGACTSDMDCLNRALRVQCSSDCSVPYCSNRRFWKEDCGNKLCVSNGPRSKRVLKTKIARRAGEFLCEYAGEVITREQAQEKFAQDRDPRIIAIAAHLFVDATKRSNIARFIKHSCKPNSRLEVWSVNGFYRAGVFALSDLNPNAEITVDKSDLLPFDMACNCGATECKRVIRGVRWRCADPNEKIVTRRFVIRNRRKTIERSSHSGLPAILQTPMDENSSIRLKMKQVLAAFAFRVRKIDGSMSRTMLPHYTLIIKFLKTKGNNPNPVEFVSLFRKWLEAIDDDDLERAFVAIESHYMSSSILSSSLQSKKAKDNAPRARALSTSCPSPVPSKRGDADLSYLESLYPIGSYDPDDAWESYSTNKKGNAVRCICGALDEEGTMVQCDTCHFWLHVDCCQYVVRSNEKAQKSKNPPSDDGEYICDFCTNKQNGLRPSADVKLTEQPDVRFENCDYYRSLINRRGIQVVLNETVYVNRVLPEDHKAMLRNLREEKKGSKQKDTNKYRFPKAATSPLPIEKVDRKNARIFRVERLFVCPGNNRFVFGSFYAWPHETYADAGRVFSKKEVFATPYYETLPLDEVIGRCLVLDTATWCKGRPKVPKFKEDDVFLCEMQIGKTQRVFEKVPPKNRYPINTNSYVFTEFTHPKKVVRDFRPYDPSNPSPKPPKTSSIPSTSSIDPPQSSSDGLPEVDTKKLSKRHIQRVLKRLVKNGSRRS